MKTSATIYFPALYWMVRFASVIGQSSPIENIFVRFARGGARVVKRRLAACLLLSLIPANDLLLFCRFSPA